MKVLVTGSDGQLGNCIQDVVKNNYIIEYIFTDYKELDITNLEEVKKFFEKEKFNYCINCAAYTAVDKAELEKEKAYQINAEGAKNLAEACKEQNTILIHISTDFVFDGSKNIPYNEEDIPNPINVYGASKLKGEQFIEEILNDYFIIRTSWVYSEHGHNFVKTMLRLSKEKDELGVVNDQFGTPTYAKDLANAIVKVIDQRNENYGLYNFSNMGETNWCDFAKTIFNKKKVDIKINPVSSDTYITDATRPKYSVLSKEKFLNKLKGNIPNWEISLEDCLSKIELDE